MKLITVSFLIIITLAHSCADSLTSGKSSSNKDGKNATVQEGAETVLSVTAGDLNGASVNVPSGALEVGSNLNINAATTPTSFDGHSGVSEASKPMSVTATSPSGEALSELNAPMTLQLPLSGTALALNDVEKTADNVCVFLESVAGEFFVWRRDSVSINDNLVIFESKLFGIYQLFFCGDQTLSAAKDAKDEKIAGSASTALITMTVPTAFALGSSSVCAGVVKGVNRLGSNAGDQFAIIAQSNGSISSDADSTVEIFGKPGSNFSGMADEDEVYVVISFQPENLNGCKDSIDGGGTLAQYFEGTRLYGFNKKVSDLKAGGRTETFGQGFLEIQTGSTQISTPSGAAGAFDSDGCYVTSANGNAGEGGFVHTQVKLKQNGTINDDAAMSHHYITTGSSDNSAVMYLNTTECLNSIVDQATNTGFENTQGYAIKWNNIDLSATIEAVPTKLAIQTNAGVVSATNRACIQLFPTSAGDVSGTANDERNAQQIFQYVTELKTSFTNDFYYLPRTNEDEYDGFIKPLAGDETCASDKPGYTQENSDYSYLGSIDLLPLP